MIARPQDPGAEVPERSDPLAPKGPSSRSLPIVSMTKARPSPAKERPESRDCQAKRDGQSQTTMIPSAIPPAGRADDVADRHPTRPETGTGGETAGAAGGSTGPPAGPVAMVTIESREPLALLGAVRSGDSWMLPVVINEIPVLALVDTGASVTMISRTVYESMNREKYPLLCSEQSSVSGVGGGKVGLMGSIKGEFQIAGGTWPLEVYVSQRQEPVSCYLGMNFFQDYGVEFRLKTGEFVDKRENRSHAERGTKNRILCPD